jgi:hypothetical protein
MHAMNVRRLALRPLSALSFVAFGVWVCGLVFVGGAGAAGDLTSASCPNEASPGFRSYLPECRAYELVTPVFKNGTEMLTSAISEDGSSLLAVSLSGFAETEANANGSNGGLYRLARSVSGWTVTAISPSSAEFPAQTWVAASPDLSSTLWLARTPAESSFAENLYIREADGVMVKIGSLLPPAVALGPPSGEFQVFPYSGGNSLVVLDESADLSHVFYSTVDGQQLGLDWPGDDTVNGGRSLYEYSGRGQSRPELVGVSDGSTVVAGENEGKPLPAGRLISACSTYLGSVESRDLYNAVSADGAVVFFTAEQGGCGGEGPEVDELYARVDGLQTVPVSEPTVVACAACSESVREPAAFAGASEDGSKVFFLTKQGLLAGTTGSGESLYEYDFDAANGGRVTRVSSGSGEPDVLGVARVSEDGSHVYFVAEGQLSRGARGGGVVGGSEGPCLAELAAGEKALEGEAEEQEANAEVVTKGSRCRPTLGGDNLYVFERDSAYPAGRVSFVATLSPGDEEDWGAHDRGREVQVTPDGRFLVLQSEADLVAGDTSSARQVFEYDALTGELARVSNEQAGFTPEEAKLDANENRSEIPTQSYSVSVTPTRPVTKLAVSGDGGVVVFASEAALTAGAVTAAGAKAESAYEYRNSVAAGGTIGEGNVFLISDGVNVRSPGETANGVDASGEDVFFGSADGLVPQDSDSQFDTYDARVGGGFPAADPPAGCAAAACEGVLYSPPVFTQPAGAAVGGSSNLPAAGGAQAPVVVAAAKKVVGPVLSRGERLARALRVCGRERGRLRVRCEALALARYGKDKHKSRGVLGAGGAGR